MELKLSTKKGEKMNTPKEILNMDILSMLNAIFGTHKILRDLNLKKKNEHQIEVGIIHSRTTRRLVVVKKDIIDHISVLERNLEVCKLEGYSQSFLNEAYNEGERFLTYETIIHQLLWFSISEEFPDVVFNDHVSIGEGWALIGEKDWHSTNLNEPPFEIPLNLMEKIREIVSGQNLRIEKVRFGPLAENDEVIYQIKDDRIQALWFLIDELETKMSEIDLLYYTKNKKGREREEKKKQYYLSLLLLLHALFWCAIRDSLPNTIDWLDHKINLKGDWKIVRNLDQKEKSLKEISLIDEILTKKFEPGLN